MSNDARQLRRRQSHERILDAAARALYRGGVAGVGVAEVMREAGLTHGGFYAHFASRDALLTEALERAGRQSAEQMLERIQARIRAGDTPLRALLEEYLSDRHMDADDGGCPVAALAAEVARSAEVLRAVSARQVRALVGLVQQALAPDQPGDSAAVAATVAATMAGALQMARVLGQEGGGRAILRDCREALLARYDHAASPS